MRQWINQRKLVPMLLIFFLLCLPNVSAFGQTAYDMQIVAQTGVPVGSGTPIALGTEPSINDAGKVSFVARDTDATHGRVMTLNNGVVEQDCFIGNLASVSDDVQINDNDQVIFRQYSDDGLFSDVIRLDGPCSGQIIGKGSFSTQFPEQFDLVLPHITLNDTGRGIFSADIGVNTMLGSRLNGTGPYVISPVLTGFPNLYPMLADNDTTVVRWGGTNTSPLLRFISTNLNTANFIAESTDFNAIGQSPGISDDGNVVAFVGDHITHGLGIFVSLFTGLDFTPIKVAGIGSTFTNFSLQARVGVNRSQSGLPNEYVLAYIGFNFLNQMGLYTTTLDITDPTAPVVLETSLIISEEDTINGLPGFINNIKIYDPVNNQGQIVFWVSTDTGAQAIVRATASTMDAFDPGCESVAFTCKGDYLTVQNNQVVVDETMLDAIVVANIQRDGIVADGVTTLLMRVKTDEQITFELKDLQEQLADTTWGVLRDLAGTTKGNTIMVNPISTNEGNAAFVVYQAPIDLPCSYNAVPCTINEISGSLHVKISATSTTTTREKSLSLFAPPLVFVHGVWSDGWAWRAMSQYLEQKGFSVCSGCLVDYGTEKPAGTFDPTEPDTFVVKQLITSTKQALIYMRGRDIAATQVDVVGHSMGGLVIRSMVAFDDAEDKYEAIQNYNKGSIHKIITVGTPHLGTQIADFLVLNKCFQMLGIGKTLEDFFKSKGRPLGPAVFGFQTDSIALGNLGATDVPTHTIIGLASSVSATEIGLNAVMKLFALSDNVDNLIDLNGNGHDTIVPRESQEGAVDPLASQTFTDVVHADLSSGLIDTGETDSQAIWDEVMRVLLALTESSEFDTIPQFTGLGTATFPVNPYIRPEDVVCPAASRASNIVSLATTTLLPTPGSIVAPGDVVNVQFDVSGGNLVDGALFVVGDKLEVLEEPGPFVFSYTVPTDYVGDMDITAYTFGPGPKNYTDTTTITVTPTTPFANITAMPDFLILDQLGLSFQINVLGYYPDSSTAKITRGSTGTLYTTQSGTNNVISVGANGLVQAQGSGTDVVLITNGAQSTSVPVEVIIPNIPPTLAHIGSQKVDEGQQLEFIVTAADPDGDALAMTAQLSNSNPLSTIGATFVDNGNTGTFDWTPSVGQAGSYDVVFTATDPAGLNDTEVVTITVLIPGDLDRDGDVDETDLSIFSTAFGSVGGNPNYNPAADFDQNGDVDGTDLAIFSSNFGRS